MFLVVVLWKPYFLYKNGFKKSVFQYWKGLLPMMLVFIGSAFIINFIKNYFYYNSENLSLFNWVIYALQVTAAVTFIYGVLLFVFVPGFKVFCKRVKTLVINKLIK